MSSLSSNDTLVVLFFVAFGIIPVMCAIAMVCIAKYNKIKEKRNK